MEKYIARHVALSLMRDPSCELVALHASLGESARDLFLPGLLPAIEAIGDMCMEQILIEIALHEDIRDAILGVRNKLREVFNIALHCETGAWEEFEACTLQLSIPEGFVPGLFMQSVDWARGVLAGHDVTNVPAR